MLFTASVASYTAVTDTTAVSVVAISSHVMTLYSVHTVAAVGSVSNYSIIIYNHSSTGTNSASIPWTTSGINETMSPIRLGGKTATLTKLTP